MLSLKRLDSVEVHVLVDNVPTIFPPSTVLAGLHLCDRGLDLDLCNSIFRDDDVRIAARGGDNQAAMRPQTPALKISMSPTMPTCRPSATSAFI
jgi:hypothetical protein